MNNITAALLILSALAAGTAAARERAPRTPSSTEREHLSGTITPEPLGIFAGPFAAVTTGLSAGIFLAPDLIIRAGLRTAKSCTSSRCSYAYDATTVSAQRFVTNSFYLEAGLAREQRIEHLQYTEDYDNYRQSSRAYAFNYQTVDAAVSFGVGQQWQWQTFTLGARWLNVTVPIATNSAEVRSLDPAYTPGDAEQRKLKRLSTSGTATLANLVLGWSF